MDNYNVNDKNSKTVKVLSWVLIFGSALILLKFLFMLKGYLSVFNNYQMTKNFDPPIEYNYTYFLIFAILEIILCIIVFISSSFVLKFRESWRKILIYSLVASIIVSFISPKLMSNALLWSTILSLFLLVAIIILSKKEIKVLFRSAT